ncbi:MAG: DUF547 domain-containing protein [Bacteroidota bacterium]
MKIEVLNYHQGNAIDQKRLLNYKSQLSAINLDRLISNTEKIAFWINVYNGLTNYFIIENGIAETVWENKTFFSGQFVEIGRFELSLDDIEHGILRRNRPRRNKQTQLAEDDPKMTLMPDQFDDRIHFALNCGSQSCPPVAYYGAAKLEEQLEVAEDNFVQQEFELDWSDHTVTCSQLFVWYRHDFEGHYLDDPAIADFTIIEKPYSWKVG